MSIEELLDLAKKRRSIRKFLPDPLPAGSIEKILEVARWAMSGANSQPWEFIIIKDQQRKRALADAMHDHDEMGRTMDLTRAEEFRKPRFRTGRVPDKLWVDAPVVIAIVGDKRTMMASTMVMRFFEHHTFDQGMANTTHMIHLAAAALGLGSQWISIDEPLNDSIKPILGIPSVITLFALAVIGYPDHQPYSYRREVHELVHNEMYDMSKFRSQADIQEFVKHLRKSHLAAGAYPVQK